MSKKYTNVYTILEKVKKGDIEKTEERYFGRMRYFKRPDLVTPLLHYIDEERLKNIVKSHVHDTDTVSTEYSLLATQFDKKKIKGEISGDRPDVTDFATKVREIFKKFPEHLMYDIFKMYYDKTEKLEFEERNDTNYSKFKFLEKANSPIRKIMSEKSQLKSAIFTREIINHFISKLAFASLTTDKAQKDAVDDILNSLKGNNSEFDNKGLEESIKKMLDGKNADKNLEKALEKAEKLCKSLDEAMNSDHQEQMFKDCAENHNANKLSPGYIKEVEESLKSISMSVGSLKEKIKKLLDKSKSYFSGREMPIYEDIFNSDNLAGLDDYIGLHPALRKIMAEDVIIKDVKRIGKIDVYVDISGSMSDTCKVKNDDGEEISKNDFAKAFVFKIKELDLLNRLFTFDNRVYESKTDPVTIAMLPANGGTAIDNAVKSVIKNQTNAIIITDAEDRCTVYSENVFFIGINGARFNHFESSVLKKYVEKEQIVIFDGKTINKVDYSGKVIK